MMAVRWFSFTHRLVNTIYHGFLEVHGRGSDGAGMKTVTLSYEHVVFPFLLLGLGVAASFAMALGERALHRLAIDTA